MENVTKFTSEQFTPTKFYTAADKAKFANQFVRFVTRSFKPTLFPKWFYQRLSNTFGHIAHYDQGGFYETWFSSLNRQLAFLKRTAESEIYGDVEYTFSDVERVLKAWVIESGLVAQYQAAVDATVETNERAELARLQTKYS